MILQALTSYYEDLVKNGKLSGPGWAEVKVSYTLVINSDGEITDIITNKTESANDKKHTPLPVPMLVPAPVKRSGCLIVSNFLCDHSGYILGVDNKGKPDRSLACFEACRKKHHEILDGVDTPAANALLTFFDKWNPETAHKHMAFSEKWEDIISGGNLVFQYLGYYLQEDPVIRETWERYYQTSANGPEMTCLVTGKRSPVEATHPYIKGIKGAQSSGAALISFNAPAFCSYGKEQNYNAPISQYAAFAYTAALNELISQRDHVNYIGDTAVLCWAEGGEPAYQGFASLLLFGMTEKYNETDILNKTKRLLSGNPVEFDAAKLDPDNSFFILGIAPNAARLSVRFFYKDSFGKILKNINEHYQRINIQRSHNDRLMYLPLWRLLQETVRDKDPSHVMTGEVLRSVITNTKYPATLLNAINLRIRAEHNVTAAKAAIIKAYYMKNKSHDVPEEVLQVALNRNSTNTPYNLGRLFAVLERIQSAANPGINTTIRDRYFNSASATPGHVFPTLINLAQKHLSKVGGGLQVVLDKEMTEIINTFSEEFPSRLNLQQQGAFQLGYYHQRQSHFQSKKEVK